MTDGDESEPELPRVYERVGKATEAIGDGVEGVDVARDTVELDGVHVGSDLTQARITILVTDEVFDDD